MKENGVFSSDFEMEERPSYLIYVYLRGIITPLERKELDTWILSSDENEQLFDELTTDENFKKTIDWYENKSEKRVEQGIKRRIAFTPERRKKPFPLSFVAVAASFIIIVSAALFFIMQEGGKKTVTNQNIISPAIDPAPGSNRAVLTLAGGKKIVLDSTAPSSLEEGRIQISEGSISYNDQACGGVGENLLDVPRGGQYKIILPDGTKVWLNAASSLRYPTAFTGGERKVSLTGEGYFEVTKNREKPFIVESPAGRIRVLGTQFNVNTYGDENTSLTTLVEGSVEISKGSQVKTLKPNEQARTKGGEISVVEVDTREYTAWKDGEFVFRDAPVHAIASQLARWYDLDIEFKEPVEKHLNATIRRDIPLSRVLHYLEQTGDLHFKLEGKKLTIMN